MKITKMLTTVLGASLLCTVGVMAQEKSTLNLTEKVTVQGTELKPGKYDVQWDGTGSSVQLSIKRGKENIVTVPATLIPRDTPNHGNAYGAKSETDGARVLTAIYPNGKKFGVEIGQSQAASAAK
jgi:hypothetical protein